MESNIHSDLLTKASVQRAIALAFNLMDGKNAVENISGDIFKTKCVSVQEHEKSGAKMG